MASISLHVVHCLRHAQNFDMNNDIMALVFDWHEKCLTLTVRPLVPPAPHPIGHALDVGGSQAVVARITGKDDFSLVLIMGTIDNSPPPVLQRKRSNARADDN